MMIFFLGSHHSHIVIAACSIFIQMYTQPQVRMWTGVYNATRLVPPIWECYKFCVDFSSKKKIKSYFFPCIAAVSDVFEPWLLRGDIFQSNAFVCVDWSSVFLNSICANKSPKILTVSWEQRSKITNIFLKSLEFYGLPWRP